MRPRHRFLVGLLLLAVAGAVAIGWTGARLLEDSLRTEAANRLRVEAKIVAGPSLLASVGDHEALQRQVRSLASSLDSRVTLIAADGIVLADSALPAQSVFLMDNHARRPEVRLAELAGWGDSVRRSGTTSVEYLYGAWRLDGPGPVRFVRLSLPWEPYRQTARGFGATIGAVGFLLGILVGGTAFLGLRRREMAIQDFAGSVEDAVRGSEPVRPTGEVLASPVLGDVASAISAMQAALLGKIRELEGERSLLSSVIAGMGEGLLLIGPDRRVRLANRAIRDVLGLPFDPHGRRLTEVVRHPTIIDDVDAIFEDEIEQRESVVRAQASGRAFRMNSVALRRGGAEDPEALLLFFDITKLESLEAVRREFVANVSHELRTPLTAIRAFVENLMDGGLEDRENAGRFLGIVQKHADRMRDLIEDLTDLSLIETGAIRLELRDVRVGDVVGDVIQRLEFQIRRRGVEIVLDVPDSFRLRADRRRLEQMISNLLDNAVKFSRPGGKIWITAEYGGDGASLRIRDEGIGVSRDGLEKIFHRFYRERRDDLPESRGTGLGLSIVKHLMRLHGGTVTVESELGSGSEFTLAFPEVPLARTG